MSDGAGADVCSARHAADADEVRYGAGASSPSGKRSTAQVPRPEWLIVQLRVKTLAGQLFNPPPTTHPPPHLPSF